MSAIRPRASTARKRAARPRAGDPRVRRTRAAALAAARTLFLRHGHGGTTMDDVAVEAGLTKRTLYNNFRDKDTLFRQMVDETIGFAESFARGLDEEWPRATKANLAARLEALGVRLALGADPRQILNLVIRDGFQPVVSGLIMGFLIAVAVRLLLRSSSPFSVSDALVFAAAPVPILIAAFLACYWPARRASRVDPNVALRDL